MGGSCEFEKKMINNTAVTKQEDMNNEKKYTVWEKYKFGEEISLEGILEIVELSPRWVKYLEDANLGEFDKCSFKEEACYRFKESLLSSLKFTQMDDRLLHRFSFKDEIIRRNGIKIEESVQPIMHLIMFDKWELINWMEKEYCTDSDFGYVLPQGFVDYCQKIKSMPTYSELLETVNTQNQKIENLENKVKKLEAKNLVNQNSEKKRKFVLTLGKQIKTDMDKQQININGVIISAIVRFLDFNIVGHEEIIDSNKKTVEGLSVPFIRQTLKRGGVLLTTNKIGKKSQTMKMQDEKTLQTVIGLFKQPQYKPIQVMGKDVKKILRYK